MTHSHFMHIKHGLISFYISSAGIAGDPYKFFCGQEDDKVRRVRFLVLINAYSPFTRFYIWRAKRKILKCFDMLS